LGWRRFFRDKRGGVAVIFALAFTPVAFLSLVMIDFSRASTARSNLQETLDASTLIAARSSAITANDIQTVGGNAFTSQVATNLGIKVNTDTFVSGADNTIVGDATASVQTLVAGLFLGGSIPISAHSEVVRSMNKLEIAMVLDTTGSMAGSKISNLKSAADDFIDTMQTASAQSSVPNAVKISIVPFSNTVKISAPVSMSGYSVTGFTSPNLPTWMDGRAQGTPYNYDIFTTVSSAQKDRIDRFKMLKQMGSTWDGCVENRVAPYDVTDDPPTATASTVASGGTGNSLAAADAASMFTPYFWPDEPDMTSKGKSFYKNNSYGSSQNDYLVDGYASNLAKNTSFLVPQGDPAKYTKSPKSGTAPTGYALGPNSGCTMQQLLPLGTDFAAMKSTVSGLVAGGETNIPIGLAWGWHSISPNLPLGGGTNGPAAYNTTNLTKVVVLMTDGDNTEDPANDANGSLYHGYGYVWQNKLGLGGTTGSVATIQANAIATSSATRTAALAARMTLLCNNMKKKGVVIYTVGVGVSSDSQKLLQACATTTSQYYSVSASGSNMAAAFSAIAGSIQNLRISK
jgi:Flp pilus assembly protein TadG